MELSSMEPDKIDQLAARIAGIISAGKPTHDLSSIEHKLEDLGRRLDKLEAAGMPQGNGNQFHPSKDKFEIAEAIAAGVFESGGDERPCMFEPAKACDHCSMCNSRGF